MNDPAVVAGLVGRQSVFGFQHHNRCLRLTGKRHGSRQPDNATANNCDIKTGFFHLSFTCFPEILMDFVYPF
jgi:hypothetical protein